MIDPPAGPAEMEPQRRPWLISDDPNERIDARRGWEQGYVISAGSGGVQPPLQNYLYPGGDRSNRRNARVGDDTSAPRGGTNAAAGSSPSH
jgi:hypothetical protein